MSYNRRKFIQATAASAAGAFVLPSWACSGKGSATARASAAKPGLRDFGLQL